MSWSYFFVGLCAAVIAWPLALRKGKDQRLWALVSFVLPPALIALAFSQPHHRTADTQAFRDRWTALASYDPEIKAAVARLTALGPEAIEQFRTAYAEVQTKESVPLIVADIEHRWAAGDRFDGTFERAQHLDALKRDGRISQHEYEAQARRLAASVKPRSPWRGLWWKLPVALVLLALIWPRNAPSGFPTCDSASAHELVRRAIEEGEDAKIRNTRLLALDAVRELSHEPAKPERYCTGLAALNAGEHRIAWRLYRRGTNLFVDVSGL